MGRPFKLKLLMTFGETNLMAFEDRRRDDRG